jgi:hypothetical protein
MKIGHVIIVSMKIGRVISIGGLGEDKGLGGR